MNRSLLAQILANRAEKKPVVLATRLTDGEQRLLYPAAASAAADALDVEDRIVFEALRSDRCQTTEGDEPWLYQPLNPPLRLVVVGAVHIAQPLTTMAMLAGYDVIVIDPRAAFAAPERFPGIELRVEWPDQGLDAIGIDSRTAVVTLTHDPKLDDPALQAALQSDAFYIGSLGSKKTHAARLARLKRSGFGEPSLNRIHAPVGLPIGSRTPAEIAVSIVAQITETLRK